MHIVKIFDIINYKNKINIIYYFFSQLPPPRFKINEDFYFTKNFEDD
jgi:hypothetical protein